MVSGHVVANCIFTLCHIGLFLGLNLTCCLSTLCSFHSATSQINITMISVYQIYGIFSIFSFIPCLKAEHIVVEVLAKQNIHLGHVKLFVASINKVVFPFIWCINFSFWIENWYSGKRHSYILNRIKCYIIPDRQFPRMNGFFIRTQLKCELSIGWDVNA